MRRGEVHRAAVEVEVEGSGREAAVKKQAALMARRRVRRLLAWFQRPSGRERAQVDG